MINEHNIVLGVARAASLATAGSDKMVGTIMGVGPTTVRPDEPLEALQARMSAKSVRSIIVTKPTAMSEADHTEIIELLASTDTETAKAVAAIQRLGLRQLQRGQPIGIDDIAHQAELSIGEVRAGVDSLIAAGRIETDGDTIVGVGGLTLAPTRHSLELPDAVLHTWCALDAVGIPAAFGLPARVTTSCPYCQAEVVVRIAAGQATGRRSVVLFCPTGPCNDVRADFCVSANLFCNPGHLAAWRHRNGDPDGTMLDLDAVAALGQQMWEPHTRSPDA